MFTCKTKPVTTGLFGKNSFTTNNAHAQTTADQMHKHTTTALPTIQLILFLTRNKLTVQSEYSTLPAVLVLGCHEIIPYPSQSWFPGSRKAGPRFLVCHPSHPDCLHVKKGLTCYWCHHEFSTCSGANFKCLNIIYVKEDSTKLTSRKIPVNKGYVHIASTL